MSFIKKMLDSLNGKDDENYENEDYEGYDEDEADEGYDAPVDNQPKQEVKPMEERNQHWIRIVWYSSRIIVL